jgi:mannosyltransferase
MGLAVDDIPMNSFGVVPHKKSALTLLLAILLLAAALRTYGVGRQALRGDEAFSVRFSEQAPSAIVAATAAAEPNPPLYWFVLHGWMRAAGTSELAVRWPSALAGVVAVAVTYCLGAALAGRPAGALAALLTAVNPFLIWYAQDARVYSLLALLVTAATWLTWRAARGSWAGMVRPGRQLTGSASAGRTHPYWRTESAASRWLAAGALWWLALFGHYFAALPAVAVALAVVAAPGTRASWRQGFVMFAGVGVLYLPWALYVAPLLAGHHKDWVAAIGVGEGLWRSLAAASAGVPGTGATETLRRVGAAVMGVLTAFGARWAIRHRPSAGLWLLLAGFLPTLLLWLISLARPVYTEQYVFGSVPALLALGAWGAWRLAQAWPGHRWLGGASVGAALLVGLLAITNAAFDPAFAKSPDWRALNDYLSTTARAAEVVVVNLPEPAFYHYYTASMPVITSPPRPLAPSVVPETEAQLAGLRDGYDHIRFLFQPTAGYDPDGFVGQWLAACCELTREEFVRGWRVQTFDTPAGSLAARQPLEAPLANGLALTGWRVVDSAPRASDTLRLTLYWTAATPVDESYTVFVHLLAADGFQVGDADSLPAGGRRPTNTWAAGETVIDPHALALPADMPGGEYRLEVGLYQRETGERVPLAAGEGNVVPLPVTIVVRAPE